MKIFSSLIYVILCSALLWALTLIIAFTMDYLNKIGSLIWFIIAIPISFILIVAISNIFLKIVTAISKFNSNLIFTQIIITLGIFYALAQIYFLWRGSDLSHTRQIIIAIYGSLCLMSGFGNILMSMNKTSISNKVAEKMNEHF